MIPEQQPIIQKNNVSLYTGSNLEVQKIANTYLVLHKIFFGLGINIIIMILAIVIVRNITAIDLTIPFPIRNDSLKSQEQQLMQTFSVVDSSSYKKNDVRVIIKQGSLSIDNQYIETSNNLVIYKGYITPRTIKIPTNNELKPISYFNNTGYDIRFLDVYLKDFVLNANKNQNLLDITARLLPLQTTFVKQFNIECLLSTKFIDTFCQKAFSEVSSIIPLYNLQQDYEGLTKVANAIEGTQYFGTFCESIKKYIFFSNDSGKEIKDIMVSCGDQYELSIADFISFRSIQEQLDRESINSTVTSSTLLNIYKLLSTQNDIYYDIVVGKKLNTTRINGYNNYVEALLKSPDSLQGFYFDVIARYNNAFLIPEITKASVAVRGESSDEYKKILEYMKKLNQGDSIARYKGLVSYIKNTNLLELGTTNLGTGNTIISIVDNFKQNYGFSDFVVKSVSGIDDKKVSVSGLLRFTDNVGLVNNTPMDAIFVYFNQRFFVSSIALPRQSSIAALINQKLVAQLLPINEVYNLIIENSKVVGVQDVCSKFIGKDTLVLCTPRQLIVTQNTITYTFNYTLENGVSSYTISNTDLDKAVKTVYGDSITITKNSLDAINLILNYRIEKEPSNIVISGNTTGGAKEVQLQKDFSQIGATIKEISENKSNTIVKFTLKNYSFIAIYDTNKKNILGLGIIIGDITYPIRNFSFSFLTAQSEEIELLKNDPVTFLLQKDPLTVKKLQLK